MSATRDVTWPLRRAAELHGDRTAVIDGDRVVTYAELARRVGALGGLLDDLGVPIGGRVGVLAENSLTHVEWFLGIPAHRRVIVDLNFRLAEDELAFMVDDAGVEVLLTDASHSETARALETRCAGLRVVIGAEYEQLIERPAVAWVDGANDDLAAISYTGGTTGRPKGVMLSRGNLLANASHNLVATGHRSDQRWLHVCPMFHVAGTANVLACTWVGAQQVVLPRFDPAAVIHAIERERITHTVLVPTMIGMLLDHPAGGDADLEGLQHIQYAASPISPALQGRLLDRVACDVAQFYGMTEAAPTVSTCTPEDHRRGHAGEEPYAARLASIGRPVAGVEMELRDAEGRPVALGQVGEIWVRGPNVMLGYWNRPDATSAALVDGWYRTGDAARRDADGYYYMVDRLKDMIITGGENVYSIEVEAVLAEHVDVVEAAVFGVPDDRWGEAVHAVVVLRPDSSAEPTDLVAHCRDRIAGFKVPRAIDVRDEPLPKSGAGKVLKNRLRDPFWKELDRRVG